MADYNPGITTIRVLGTKNTWTVKMATALSYGVELEMLIALNQDPFKRKEEQGNRTQYIQPREGMQTGELLRRHIINTLETGGIACYPFGIDGGFNKWSIVSDSSVTAMKHEHNFIWNSIEVISPAYYIFDDTLNDIRKTCRLLAENYMIHINETAGMHVHVGLGHQRFQLGHLRRLLAFFWGFEEQLNTLHPEHRSAENCGWARSLREQSIYANRSTTAVQKAVLPGIEEGIRYFLGQRFGSTRDIAKEAGGFDGNGKTMAYNFSSIALEEPLKHTIEFRQAAGTIDEDEIVTWIRTCVGIVDFCRCVDGSEAFDRVISLAREKDSPDKVNVIQLLRRMGLGDQADFYKERGLYFNLQKQSLPSFDDDGFVHLNDDREPSPAEGDFQLPPNAFNLSSLTSKVSSSHTERTPTSEEFEEISL
ncbi:hypothetical protein BP5796_01755 [Coleophoma crateriformis]|uniref:Amidoligase enzyme n=1 Tax=Coleophoma crateriformis TaxID=565419 RepID=A0A3D8T1R9_9HELO|nr:hypothetical protein BP5796_01755 [Coleophoma crateriformis]